VERHHCGGRLARSEGDVCADGGDALAVTTLPAPTCSQVNNLVGISPNLDGTFTLAFLGTPGAQYCVMWQTNAAEPMANWTVLADSTNTILESSGLWSITVTNDGLSRFYRSKALGDDEFEASLRQPNGNFVVSADWQDPRRGQLFVLVDSLQGQQERSQSST
jgi:hypothetical protein